MPNREPPARGAGLARVGRYQIVGYLASGGIGAVYRAVDPDLGRTVALKVLSPEMAAKPTILERFRREARLAARCRHENIVQIYEFGESNGTYFLALEFVDGGDLQRYLERHPGGRLPAELARDILVQGARALDHTHAQGFVHRDIKPSNFLLTTKAGRLLAKLSDLGLAREADDAARLTRENTTLGTVDYISPEQARVSTDADIRSDLYSLGCTVFHLVAGQPPFPKGNLIERLQHHLSTPPPDVRELCPGLPEDLARAINRLLCKKPEERYPTPLHLLRELETPAAFERYLEETKDLKRPEAPPEPAAPAEEEIFTAASLLNPAPPDEATATAHDSGAATDGALAAPAKRPEESKPPARPKSGPARPKSDTLRAASAQKTPVSRSTPEKLPRAAPPPPSPPRQRNSPGGRGRSRKQSSPWTSPGFLILIVAGSLLVAALVFGVLALVSRTSAPRNPPAARPA